MSVARRIPAHHQTIVAAAVRAVLGERAVVRKIAEVPAPTLLLRVRALDRGVRTFWNRWTERRSSEEHALR